MFRVHQVRYYRGQLSCVGNRHHHHFITAAPCGPYNTSKTSSGNLSGMPPLLNLSNFQQYENNAQECDNVVLSKKVSQITPESNSVNQMNDNSGSNKTIFEDENTSSKTLQETLTSTTISNNTRSDTQSSNGYSNSIAEDNLAKSLDEKENLGLTWIDWDWPGNHTPCPFSPCKLNGQLSTHVHRHPVR